MTSLPEPIVAALESHESFSPASNGAYELTTTVFDSHVTAASADGKRDGRLQLTITLPTLDAAVAGEPVAPAVEDGWYRTLERRLADVFTVAHTDTHDEPALERDATTVTVTLEYIAWDAGEGVADAKALIEYVEGTYAQGIIPGYEYHGPAATLLESAQSHGQQGSDGKSGGMPM